jgi:hypothetical protein
MQVQGTYKSCYTKNDHLYMQEYFSKDLIIVKYRLLNNWKSMQRKVIIDFV